ncbi:hypothetical protein GQ42DRAFT_29405 [Ramicandelaber brevisporus]|nr:hypothetical protein GQ42DRAFT_29405 [Ramicandelaber brevisporus]
MRTSTRQQQHMYPFQERFDRSPTQTRRGIQERSSFLSAFGAFRSPPSQHQQHHQQQQQQYQQQSTSTLTGSGASNNNHRASLRSLTWQIPLQQDELGQTTSTATNPAVSSLSRRRSSGAFSESSLTEYSDDEIDYTYLPSDYLNNGFRLPPSPLPADAIDHPLAFFNVPSPSSASIRTGGRASSSMAPSIAESRISSIYNLPRASGDSASISNISTRPMFHGRFGDRQATAATTTTTTTTTTSGSITSNIPNSSASSLHRRGRSMSSLHSLFTSSEDSSNPFNFNAPPQQPASSSTSTVRQPQPSLQTMSTTSVATTGDHYSSAESPTVVRSPISPVATMRSYVDAFTNSAADADESRSSSTEPQIDAFGFTNAVRDNPLRRRSSIPTNQQISSSIRSMRSMFPNISRQRIVEVLQESDYDATRAVSVLLDE